MKFSVIYADPPWKFHVWGKDTGKERSAESHYPTMNDNQLLRLPVKDLAQNDCALFMWATMPKLPLALKLGEAWGFTYKTCAFLWAKTTKKTDGKFVPSVVDDANWHIGMGYWSRANTEPCLLFVRGNPKRKARNVRQLIVAPVAAHSQKPAETYARIEGLIDAPPPFLELFARNRRKGWVSVGNELTGRDIGEDLTLLAKGHL